jgi:hypothetical protein
MTVYNPCFHLLVAAALSLALFAGAALAFKRSWQKAMG